MAEPSNCSLLQFYVCLTHQNHHIENTRLIISLPPKTFVVHYSAKAVGTEAAGGLALYFLAPPAHSPTQSLPIFV